MSHVRSLVLLALLLVLNVVALGQTPYKQPPADVVMETMYPGYAALANGEQLAAAMNEGRWLAVDVAHLDIQMFHGILAKSVSEAARFVVERGLAEESAPVLLRLVSQIAARFGVIVTQKLAAQAVPVIGAAGGAAVNYAFIDHFQDVARGHFTVRRLERRYGKERIRAEYDLIA